MAFRYRGRRIEVRSKWTQSVKPGGTAGYDILSQRMQLGQVFFCPRKEL